MASVLPQKPTASAKYDAFVETQLDKARRRIRVLDVSSALLLFLAGSLGYALVVGLLDRKLELSPLARQIRDCSTRERNTIGDSLDRRFAIRRP